MAGHFSQAAAQVQVFCPAFGKAQPRIQDHLIVPQPGFCTGCRPLQQVLGDFSHHILVAPHVFRHHGLGGPPHVHQHQRGLGPGRCFQHPAVPSSCGHVIDDVRSSFQGRFCRICMVGIHTEDGLWESFP